MPNGESFRRHPPPQAGGTPSWLTVAPFLLAFIQVSGTFGAAYRQPEARTPDAVAVALALAGPTALLLIPSRTRLLLAAVSVATFTYLALGYPYGPIFASFAIAVVIAVMRAVRIEAWAAVVVVLGLASPIRALSVETRWSWGWFAGVTAWGLIVVGTGELLRLNRARQLEARRARAEERRRQAGEERLRIARELHDVVAHHMSLIHVQAGVALHVLDRKPDQVETALTTIKDASKEALTELRALIGVLRADGEPAPRAPVASLPALQELAARTSQAGVSTTVDVHGDLGGVPASVGSALFRIAQEAVTNVVRHSGATRARIVVSVGDGAATLSVTDNGRGGGQAEEGTGLRGMRERATALGGDVSFGPADGGGAELKAELPLGGDA
jgi:signal transduction histidine kinase